MYLVGEDEGVLIAHVDPKTHTPSLRAEIDTPEGTVLEQVVASADQNTVFWASIPPANGVLLQQEE
jgi:hypothetical protein